MYIYDEEINKHLKKLSQNQEIVSIYDYIITSQVDNISNRLIKLNIPCEKLHIKFEDFMLWAEKINYINNYPNYERQFNYNNNPKEYSPLLKKIYEHYISQRLLNIQENDTYLDVASSSSCFPEIVEKFHTLQVYRQDLNYPKGVNGNRIGSNASAIPLKDESISKIALHCSIEHFENDADFDFLKESYRILKEQGKVCITPLYFSDEYVIVTSPFYWKDKYKNAHDLPIFNQKAKILIWDELKQRQEKFFSPEAFAEFIEPLKLFFNFKIIIIENYEEIKGTMRYMNYNQTLHKVFFPYVLILEKK